MSAKSRELGTAALGGLVVGSLVSAILSMAEVPFSTIVGAFIGGGAAGYLLFGKPSQAALAGALAGFLGTPFLLGISDIIFIFGFVSVPSGPTPSLEELQQLVIFIVLLDSLVGAAGGATLAAFRRPVRALPPPPPPPGAAPAAGQAKYCVQCGAQIVPGATVCPHCNAKQPQ